ncbi:MAG: STAS domain-containing protein [Candidatus Hinthialibacter antarcticus]|nr:STAS domain-containing protein [Candidatus Hinthialibacter antarcticus]
MNREPMELDVSAEAAYTAVRITGPIIATHSPELRTLIAETFEQGKSMIIDISGCDYMDSSGIATLVEGVQLAESKKSKFILTGAFSEKVKHLFEITRLDALFDEYHCDTIEEAAKQFTS